MGITGLILGILCLSLFIYWGLGAYFFWDMAWLESMGDISDSDRVERFVFFLFVFCGVGACFAPIIEKICK